MDRSTKKDKSGYYLTGNGIYGDWGVPENFRGADVDRLAAYEDTGLEPEEVLTGAELAGICAGMLALAQYQCIGTVEEFRALKDAEQKRREGCEFCHDDACISRCQMREYRLCPHCGRDLRGERHEA